MTNFDTAQEEFARQDEAERSSKSAASVRLCLLYERASQSLLLNSPFFLRASYSRMHLRRFLHEPGGHQPRCVLKQLLLCERLYLAAG